MEHPNRFEAAHMRHEDIHDHQLKRVSFERPQSRLAAVGNGHLAIVR
jgi:hypothetical protein